MRVAIVENTAITHHGQVGVALHEAGALIRQYRPFADGILPEPGSFDGLVVFGGEQSALSDATHSYLPVLGALMARQAADGVAVLGVCLGSQVFARGLGARNLIGTAPEFGWCEVALTAEGRDDPVLGGLPDAFPIFEWHSDTFTLPEGVVHLAQSPAAPAQCFRHGRAGYGMQFHFEANRAVVADWTRTFPELVEGMEPGWTEALPGRAAKDGMDCPCMGGAGRWIGFSRRDCGSPMWGAVPGVAIRRQARYENQCGKAVRVALTPARCCNFPTQAETFTQRLPGCGSALIHRPAFSHSRIDRTGRPR